MKLNFHGNSAFFTIEPLNYKATGPGFYPIYENWVSCSCIIRNDSLTVDYPLLLATYDFIELENKLTSFALNQTTPVTFISLEETIELHFSCSNRLYILSGILHVGFGDSKTEVRFHFPLLTSLEDILNQVKEITFNFPVIDDKR